MNRKSLLQTAGLYRRYTLSEMMASRMALAIWPDRADSSTLDRAVRIDLHLACP